MSSPIENPLMSWVWKHSITEFGAGLTISFPRITTLSLVLLQTRLACKREMKPRLCKDRNALTSKIWTAIYPCSHYPFHSQKENTAITVTCKYTLAWPGWLKVFCCNYTWKALPAVMELELILYSFSKNVETWEHKLTVMFRTCIFLGKAE